LSQQISFLASHLVAFGVGIGDDGMRLIMNIQRANKEESILVEETSGRGYVTLSSDYELLKTMCERAPQIVARPGNRAVEGYTLAMPPSFGDKIRLLHSIHQGMETIPYRGKNVADRNSFVIGQIHMFLKNTREKASLMVCTES
jgi:hypothetical protein